MTDEPELNLNDILGNEELKSADDLSEEQKTYLGEHKEELTTAEAQKFGITRDPLKPETRSSESTDDDPEDKKKNKDDNPDAEDDAELDPEDKKTIDTRVDKKVREALDPVLKQNRETQNRLETDLFVSKQPEYAVYRDSIIEHLNNLAYSKIPVARIAAMIAAPDLMKMGARKEREATANADKTKNLGTSARVQGGKPDWANAPKDDFIAKRAEVLGQGRANG